MKKKTVLAVLAVCAGLALTGCDTVNVMIGTFSIADTSETTTAEPDVSETAAEITAAAEVTTAADADETGTTADETGTTADETTTTAAEVTQGAPAAEGGNSGFAGYIEVTVSKDKYFYENHEIPFEELVEVLDGLDGDTAVLISDEDATLKAYEELTSALKERKIMFEMVG